MRDALVRIQAGLLAAAALLCSVAAAAAEPPQPKAPPQKIRVALPDAGEILLTDTAVSCSKGGKALWTRQASLPEMPLLFEDSKGTPLLLYFEADPEMHKGLFFEADAKTGKDLGNANAWGHAVFRAVEVESGKERWGHDFYSLGVMQSGGQRPISPLFAKPWIYFGRACWLDRMDPDTGIIAGRLSAWENIQSLQSLPNGTLSVELKFNSEPKRWVLTYRDGRFLSPLVSGEGLGAGLTLFRFASYGVPEFFGASKDTTYSGYLDLFRFKREPFPAGFEARWRNNDLSGTERDLREAYRQDPLNPYLPLFLAFCLHYQGRDAEAEPAFQEALQKSDVTWHDPLSMGRLCEDLGLTRWADPLYERGTRAYFAVREAPPETVTLVEVLVHFPAQRVASLLFATGHADRALHLVTLRRQMYPFTEGDPFFSRLYATWLRDIGQELKAREEEARSDSAARRGATAGFLDPWPWWFKGWLAWFGALFLLLALTAYRVFGGWDFALALPLTLLLANLVSFMKLAVAGGVILLGFCLLLAFFGVRREYGAALKAAGRELPKYRRLLGDGAFWATASRSPLVWLILCFSAAAVVAGRWDGAWIVLLPVLALLARLGAKRLERAGLQPQRRAGRHWVQFAGTLLLLWAVVATLTWHIAVIGVLAANPLTSDLGHPVWQHRLVKMEGASGPSVQSQEGRFAAALSLHLGSTPADPRRQDARHRYESLASGSRPDARALNNLGTLEADPAKALALYVRAAEADPACAAALYNVGVAKKDATLVEKARALDPWRVEVFQTYKPDRPMVATLTTRQVAECQMPVSRLGMLMASSNPYAFFGASSLFNMMWTVQ